MALNFPSNPNVGDKYEEFTWDGVEWSSSSRMASDTLPAGTVIAWTMAQAPSGWLICDGSAVSRTTYAALYSIIGVTYGSGNGSTTFNLPDYRGRVLVGRDTSQTEFTNMGQIGGAKTHTLSTSEMPSHNHGDYGHSHTQNVTANSGGPAVRRDYVSDGSSWTYWQGCDTFTAYANISYTGGGGAHNNLQPYQVVNYIIKTTYGTTGEMTQGAQTVAGYAGRLTDTETRLTNLERPGRVVSVYSTGSGNTYANGVTANTFYDWPNGELTLTLTPKKATNKFLVMASVTVGSNSNDAAWRFVRDATVVGVGNSNGNRHRTTAGTGWINGADANHSFTTISGSTLDSPGTASAISYRIQYASEGGTAYLNRSGTYGNDWYIFYSSYYSSLTVLEIDA